jgi:hypothetical protein
LGIINKGDYTLRVGKELVIRPKWKSKYRRRTSSQAGGLDVNELSEIGFLILRYSVSREAWVELGLEETLFYNLVEKPAVPPLEYVDDFKGTVLGLQFSNTSDYLGYRLTANVGFRWEKKFFEEVSRVNTMLFLRIYAGAQD